MKPKWILRFIFSSDFYRFQGLQGPQKRPCWLIRSAACLTFPFSPLLECESTNLNLLYVPAPWQQTVVKPSL